MHMADWSYRQTKYTQDYTLDRLNTTRLNGQPGGHTCQKRRYIHTHTRNNQEDTLVRIGATYTHTHTHTHPHTHTPTLGTTRGTHSAEWALQIGPLYTRYTQGVTLGRMSTTDWHNIH